MNMILAPFMNLLEESIKKRLRKNRKPTPTDGLITQLDAEYFSILTGFGQVGRRVGKILVAGGATHLALDSTLISSQRGRKMGFLLFTGMLAAMMC